MEIQSFRDNVPAVALPPTNFESGCEDMEAAKSQEQTQTAARRTEKRRKNVGRLVRTNTGERYERGLGFVQAYTVFKRKERQLHSLQHTNQTRERLRTAEEVAELSKYIRGEMQHRRISDFWDSGSTSTACAAAADSPVASPTPSTFRVAAQDTANDEHETPPNAGKKQAAQRTPPKYKGMSNTLLHRLSQAPYKKSVMDAPVYAYNSDDDFF